MSWQSGGVLVMEALKWIRKGGVTVDIGCGLAPHVVPESAEHICVDPYQPYLDRVAATPGWKVPMRYVQATWDGAVKERLVAGVDRVFLFDVIEHLPKEEGQRLLVETLKQEPKQVVLFTPIGFMPQETDRNPNDPWVIKDGDWQTHRSGWVPDEFPDWFILSHPAFHKRDGQTWGAFFAIWNHPDHADSSLSAV